MRRGRLNAWLVVLVSVTIGMIASGTAWARHRAATHRTLFVKAGVEGRGDGSRRHPFATLAAVKAAGRPGDAIVVLPSPASLPPLDGGIALKPRQKLLGAGAPVTKLSSASP